MAKNVALEINNWRKANIEGYNAVSWADCELTDVEYDKSYKHQTDDLWFVPLDNDTPLTVERIKDLPEGWKKQVEDFPI